MHEIQVTDDQARLWRLLNTDFPCFGLFKNVPGILLLFKDGETNSSGDKKIRVCYSQFSRGRGKDHYTELFGKHQVWSGGKRMREKVGHKTLLWLLQEGMGRQAKQLSLGLGNLSDFGRLWDIGGVYLSGTWILEWFRADGSHPQEQGPVKGSRWGHGFRIHWLYMKGMPTGKLLAVSRNQVTLRGAILSLDLQGSYIIKYRTFKTWLMLRG